LVPVYFDINWSDSCQKTSSRHKSFLELEYVLLSSHQRAFNCSGCHFSRALGAHLL
jgi:hypothetical protein